MSLLTFKGGVHPPENKEITEGKSFKNISVPQKCYIPLQQHIGKPAELVVQKGDQVEIGQLIGKSAGFISSNIHSSVPGKVIDICDMQTVYSKRASCVVIEVEGEFQDTNIKSANNWSDLSAKELLQKVTDAGIVGMGGAAFPTNVKLSPPPDKTIDTLIINCAECEPYLTVDDNLMQTFSKEIIEGVRIALKILGIKKAFLGIENNKPKATSIMKERIKEMNISEKIKVASVKTKYPQGAEKQLIYSITKREVPCGCLPADAHVVVQNVGTIFAIYEAICFDKPLYERYLTVTGKIVKNPGNYKVRIGTTIQDIIDECGLTEEPAQIIMGGPMCGLSIDNTAIPIIKGTSGILFLSRKEIFNEDYSECIRCGRCVEACPMNMLPGSIAEAVELRRFDLVEKMSPFDCIMCGSCTFVCPAKRPISHFIKVGQQELRKKKK